MRLYRYEIPDHPDAVWTPLVRIECDVPAIQAMGLLLDGWTIYAPGREAEANSLD